MGRYIQRRNGLPTVDANKTKSKRIKQSQKKEKKIEKASLFHHSPSPQHILRGVRDRIVLPHFFSITCWALQGSSMPLPLFRSGREEGGERKSYEERISLLAATAGRWCWWFPRSGF
jgi:hypothetical protein